MHPQRQLDARRSNLAEREQRQSQGTTSKILFSDDFSIEKSANAKNVARTGPNSGMSALLLNLRHTGVEQYFEST